MSFGYMGGEYGGGVSFVDFNQDGWDDLTIPTGFGEPLRFFINNGGGFDEIDPLVENFTETKQVLWVDIDNDQDYDLYVTSKDVNRLYENTGSLVLVDITESSGFNDPTSQSFCCSWLDYDEDSFLDLIVSHRHSHLIGDITLYRNLGNNTFQDVTMEAGLVNLGNSVLAMATLDINNDGWEDIYVGQDYEAGNLVLLNNNGDGTFQNASAGNGGNVQNDSMSVTIGDYDGDGDMDIYVTNTSPGNSLLQNQGDNNFIDVAIDMNLVLYAFTWGAVFLDADCDMDQDLNINGINSGFMFENPGAGLPFIDQTFGWGFASDLYYSVGNAIGDIDNDGRPDIFKNGSSGDPSTLWRNEFNDNNFLTVELVAFESNSMAIGSLIEVVAGGQSQIVRLGCGEGFSSQNANRLFFGLGQESIVDEINVSWPNGLITSVTDVEVNQHVVLYELSCSDPSACNYNPEAGEEEFCLYQGCTDTEACNFNPDAGCEDDSCDYNCFGCTDPQAVNWDPGASIDDGSCFYSCTPLVFEIATDCWGFETGWSIAEVDGEIIAFNQPGEYESLTQYTWSGCIEDGCYELILTDTFGDGLAGSATGCEVDGYYELTLESGGVLVPMEDPNYGFEGTFSFCLPVIPGCADQLACNYNAEAEVDDGTCTYPGCTDPNAATFDPEAGCDDGSCLYPPSDCVGDLNYDQVIDVTDLLLFLTVFGTICD